MADSIAHLRAALALASDVDQSSRGKLPSSELRFTVELTAVEDPAVLRARIQQLVGSDRFLLEQLDVGPSSAGRFQVLRFPTLERVFAQHDLFDIGYTLADALGLASAEPDLGVDVFRDPEPPLPTPNPEANLLGSLCWSEGEAPADLLWALKNTKLDRASQLARGEGILIGQPDTGIAQHTELTSDMFALELAADILGGGTDPTDPLSAGMANPGHGTATSSVLASRAVGQITGAAPAARIVPIRCIDDVKVFNTAPVAAAIAHAVRCGCHVISMSLGGIAGRALHAAVQEAVASDIIVVAASGNCVGVVVWPARYREVIAAGGTGPSDQPWKGSSRGARIAVSAPAEWVWRAERRTSDGDPGKIGPSQGTSYATAILAGAAAVWLSKHGRDNIIQEARRRGTSVARLFTTALKTTARVPQRWDPDLGAGILDAERLVNLSLAAIPAAQAEAVPEGEDDWVQELLLEHFGPAQRDPGFDTKRFQAELSAIALSQAKFGRQLSNLSPEAKSPGTKPSTRLRDAVRVSPDQRLQRFGQSPGAAVAKPPLPAPSLLDLGRVRLALPTGAVAEAADAGHALESARDYLRGDGGSKLLDDAQRIVRTTSALDRDRNFVLESVQTFIHEMRSGAVGSAKGLIGLEALIALKGRPALRVRDGDVDHEDPQAEQWGFAIFNVKSNSRFAERVGAVGRIDLDGEHVGTGYVVGPELVLTNRHVLQEIAYPTPKKNKPAQWLLKGGDCVIDFAEVPLAESSASKFRIVAVEEAGPLHIDYDFIDLRKPDFALLHVAPKSHSGNNDLPKPLELSRQAGWMNLSKDMAVVGYPARPSVLPQTVDGKVDYDALQRLQALFATDYGTKFFSPGKVQKALKYSAEEIPYTSSHDATTLGGSSGSVIVSIDAPMRAIGLHFGGAWRTANFAHGLVKLTEFGHLFNPNINWVD